MTSFYSDEELRELGLKSVGTDVRICRKVSIYGENDMIIGDHVRIDDYVVLSGHIEIGSYVHIATHTVIFGGQRGLY